MRVNAHFKFQNAIEKTATRHKVPGAHHDLETKGFELMAEPTPGLHFNFGLLSRAVLSLRVIWQ